MRHLEATVVVPGPPDRAFDVAVDPHQIARQMPWIQRIHDVRGRGDRIGDSFLFRDHLLGRSERGMTVVTACHRPSFQTWETTYDNGFRLIWSTHFAACDGGTEIRNVVWWARPDHWIGRVEELAIRPVLQHRLREAGERWRRHLVREDLAAECALT
jgi:hypothetical protein